MADEEIRQKLEQLHDDIQNIDHVDEQGREILMHTFGTCWHGRRRLASIPSLG
jgi:hypothetical protein